MVHPYWPLFDLRITTPDLVLRPMTEADQPIIAELIPEDAELDPAATTYGIGDAAITRGIITHQSYWKAYGTWKPEAWRLNFMVAHEGEPVGVQELEGNDFVRLRTVDSSSFLGPEARGRGFGKQMRRAVLALAFGPLGAQAAITSAWQDNGASLGVSRSIGYMDNGVETHRRDDGTDTMVHLRLTRTAWLAAGHQTGIEIAGFEPTRALFGLATISDASGSSRLSD